MRDSPDGVSDQPAEWADRPADAIAIAIAIVLVHGGGRTVEKKTRAEGWRWRPARRRPDLHERPGTMRAVERQDVVYQVVAARLAQWDMLVWQVPVLSLTAQAFLFTIALGAVTSQTSRVISSALASAMAFLSITLMARHRRAEVIAHWLADYERRYLTGEGEEAHGPVFATTRSGFGLKAGRVGEAIPNLRGFQTWVLGLSGFGAAALLVLVLAVIAPGVFER